MTQEPPRDVIDDLRHANPHPTGRLPTESRARVWAHIQEDIMSEARTGRGAQGGHAERRLPRWSLALAGAVAVGVAATAFVLGGIGADPSPGTSPGTGIGSCVETYSLAALANRSWAFDGTVTAVAGEQVTFQVNHAFRGQLGDDVTLTAIGMTGTTISSAGGPTLAVGDRYLVAGEDEFVWSCGFTQPYDATVAAQWAEATR